MASARKSILLVTCNFFQNPICFTPDNLCNPLSFFFFNSCDIPLIVPTLPSSIENLHPFSGVFISNCNSSGVPSDLSFCLSIELYNTSHRYSWKNCSIGHSIPGTNKYLHTTDGKYSFAS